MGSEEKKEGRRGKGEGGRKERGDRPYAPPVTNSWLRHCRLVAPICTDLELSINHGRTVTLLWKILLQKNL